MADGFGEWEGEGLGVGIVEEPAAVGLAFAPDELPGFVEARIEFAFGFGVNARREACGAEVVERAEDVVVVARREGEFEELLIGYFAGGAAAEEKAGKKIFLGAVAGGGDFICVRICLTLLLRSLRLQFA